MPIGCTQSSSAESIGCGDKCGAGSRVGRVLQPAWAASNAGGVVANSRWFGAKRRTTGAGGRTRLHAGGVPDVRRPYNLDIWQPPSERDRRNAMGSKRPKRSEIDRLSVKTLDDQFLTEIQKGLNCSPFESEAVLSVVREVFAPLMGIHPSAAPPGTMSVIAVDGEEPAGKPLAMCRKRTVSLLVHRGAED